MVRFFLRALQSLAPGPRQSEDAAFIGALIWGQADAPIAIAGARTGESNAEEEGVVVGVRHRDLGKENDAGREQFGGFRSFLTAGKESLFRREDKG